MKKLTSHQTLFTALALALASGGCAKMQQSIQTQQQDAISFMSTVLQLPLPDNSYAAATPQDVLVAESNAHALSTTVDLVAVPLKEITMSLAATVNKGTRSSDGLTIKLPAQNTELDGVRNDADKTITWTYKAYNLSPYFSGKTSLLPGTGDLTFPASSLSVQVVVHWQYTNTAGSTTNVVTVTNSLANFVSFTETLSGNSPTPSVKFAGKIGGSAISGAWDSTGGTFTDTNNTTKCWNNKLQNANCPTTTSH